MSSYELKWVRLFITKAYNK